MDTSRPQLIVGLGNPGEEYQATRHNIGFMVIDRLLERLPKQQFTVSHQFDSWIGTVPFAGSRLTLQKPMTFMNLSGKAVAPLARRLDIKPESILVVYDDLDLPFGRMRIRRKGSSGGHNGVESLIQSLASGSFSRLRLGIGKADRGSTIDHVLDAFSDDEAKPLEEILTAAVDAIVLAIRRGPQTAMNEFNGFSLRDAEDDPQSGARDD